MTYHDSQIKVPKNDFELEYSMMNGWLLRWREVKKGQFRKGDGLAYNGVIVASEIEWNLGLLEGD